MHCTGNCALNRLQPLPVQGPPAVDWTHLDSLMYQLVQSLCVQAPFLRSEQTFRAEESRVIDLKDLFTHLIEHNAEYKE